MRPTCISRRRRYVLDGGPPRTLTSSAIARAYQTELNRLVSLSTDAV